MYYEYINIYKWETLENFQLREMEEALQFPDSSHEHILTPLKDSCIQRSNFNWFQ